MPAEAWSRIASAFSPHGPLVERLVLSEPYLGWPGLTGICLPAASRSSGGFSMALMIYVFTHVAATYTGLMSFIDQITG